MGKVSETKPTESEFPEKTPWPSADHTPVSVPYFEFLFFVVFNYF